MNFLQIFQMIAALVAYFMLLTSATSYGPQSIPRSLAATALTDLAATTDAFVANPNLHGRDYIEDEEKMPTNWQGSATVEVYISSTPRISIGNVVGSALYGTVWQSLSVLCPLKKGNKMMKECSKNSMPFNIKYLTDSGGIGGKSSPSL
jgi:hypothetical protein